MSKKCTNKTKHIRSTTDMGVYHSIKWLELILIAYMRPFMSIIAIINNIFVSLVIIRNRRLKSSNKRCFDEVMYSHLLINSIFNILFASLMSTSLLNTCVYNEEDGERGIFCSSLYRTNNAQLFKIWGVEFLGNLTKTCVNISFTMFAFTRLLLVASNLTKRLKSMKTKFENLKIKFFIPFLIVFSVLISLHKLFEYEINEYMKATLGFPNESHNELYCENRSCAFFDTLKMLNDCLNDFCFFVVNVLIDLILLKCVRMELKKKEELRGADADNADIKKHQNNVDNMTLLNGLAYFV